MRRTLITALVAGLIVLMALRADAATRDLIDPSRDVMTLTLDDDWNETYNRDGGAEADIVFARIQHTATQVVMYTRYRQLSVPRQYASFQYTVEGNNHQAAFVNLETRHARPQGQAFSGSANGRRCAVSHHINYAADSISVRMARGCLKSPKYIRLSHLSYRIREDGSALKILYDAPTRNGGTLNQVSNSVTPWVVTG